MTSTRTRRHANGSSSRATIETSRTGRTDPSSETLASRTKTDWASVKLPRPLALWVKQKAAARGVFMSELIEELISRAIGGSKPWVSREP